MGHQVQQQKDNIIVLGGGSAGWLSACILAKRFNCAQNPNFTVTLIESPEIATIGVGEGTVPTMRQTLKLIGVSETEFMRECDVTLKQSIKFIDWCQPLASGQRHFYHHAFHYPVQSGFEMTPYWLLAQQPDYFANWVGVQQQLCEGNLAPKRITDAEYQGLQEYAYHLDAHKFAKFLQKHGTSKLGIRHIQTKVTDVVLADDGAISSLNTDTAGSLVADFFVDCSGFTSRLIGQALQVAFIDKGDQLFVDNAVAVQVPYQEEKQEIPCFTLATAKDAGWVWDIGLTGRRGVGFVYSSNHTSHDQAFKTLHQYLGVEEGQISPRKIPMRIGYREKFWHKNCVSIGLSAGFVEPLEATALLLIEAMAKLLAEKLPQHQEAMDYAEKSYNSICQKAWHNVIDFIKLHYLLSNRTDSEFWRDNRDPKTVPKSLLEKLTYWRHHLPSATDFPSRYEVFQLENYQYVLYGMNFETDLTNQKDQFPLQDKASQVVEQLKIKQQQLSAQLSGHRQFIEQVQSFGMNKI